MLHPEIRTEIDNLTGYIDDQLDALRNAAYGLTDDQARQTPTRSTLSIGALLKHTAYGMEGASARFAGQEAPGSFEDYYSNLAMSDQDTLASLLARFDTARERYLAAVASLDPAAEIEEPPAPWYGRPAASTTNLRYYVTHHVEEFARHAGHADIIREQIDGATSVQLFLAANDLPGNDFAQPWTPTP